MIDVNAINDLAALQEAVSQISKGIVQ